MAALKVYELLSKLMLACLGAMTLMRKEECPRKISDEQVFVVLVLASVNGGRIGS